jgi:putative acetyltransferase
MPYTPQAMVPGDYDAVANLWRSCPGVGLNEGDERAGVLRYLERNPGMSLVVRDAGGAIIAAVLCGHDGRRGYLYHLAVAEKFRNQGIASMLVNASLAKLRDAGLPRCSILVFANNEPGKAFWRRLGWSDRSELGLMQIAIEAGK